MSISRLATNVFVLVFLLFGLVSIGRAGDVGSDMATWAAQNWLQSYACDSKAGDKCPYRIIGKEEILDNSRKVAGYNFLLSPVGHIIVPARDELPVVKLYSFTATLSMKERSDIADWIRNELFRLNKAVEANAADSAGFDYASTINGRLWDRFGKDPSLFMLDSKLEADTETLSIGPLLSTTWNQGDPYNMNTPLWYDGRKTYTGCVATAAAQIMKYWNHPATGQGSTSYTWNNGSADQTLSADFSTSTYDWASMTNGYGSGSTAVQKQAVAKLMSDVGIAFHMNYGPDASGAGTLYAATVFPTYFKYKNTIQSVYRSSYDSDSAWMQVFKNEVQNGRPSQMRISDPSAGGHSIVVDGYQDAPTEQIHLNLGWGGGYNGWYVSNNIVTGSYNWSDINYQAAVIGIEPDTITGTCNPPASITVPAASTGSYTVSWGASSTSGVTYVLQESTSSSFATVTTAYSGTALSTPITKTSSGTFYYRVKATKSGNTDSGYVAGANPCVVTTAGTITLPEAIDRPTWSVTTGGSANWFGQSPVSHDATDAAQSGVLTHSQSSYMQAGVTGPGILSFWWRVSSESSYDYLRFYLDGVEKTAAISGETAWAQVTGISVPSGTHTLKWEYVKDGSVSNGTDAGWVDQVVFAAESLLTVNRLGLGAGSITPSTGTLTWSGKSGTASYPAGTTVVLTAATGPGSVFGGWGGACSASGTSPTCTVTMSAAKTVTATFNGKRILVLDNSNNEMGSALDIIGYSYTRLDAAAFAGASLSSYDVIMTAWLLPAETAQALVNRKAALASWVTSGGRLFASSATGNDWSWVPLSVTPSSVAGEDVSVVAPSHPLMTTPHLLTSASLTNWYTSYHNVWSAFDPAYQVVTTNGSNQAIVLSASYGSGMIVVSGSDPEWHTINGPIAGRYYLENLLTWGGYNTGGRITGTVTDSFTHAPISGVTVRTTGPSTATGTSGTTGTYSINYLPPGTYTLTATKAGYQNAVITGKAVTSGGTTTVNFSMIPSVSSVNITSISPPSPSSVGTPVVFTAAASGGSGSYQYQYKLRNAAGVWSVVRAYNTAPSWTWNTAGLAAGNYRIEVWARNAGSTAAWEAYKTVSYTLAPPATAVTLTSSAASPQSVGNKIVFTSVASGGSGTYEYQFRLRNPSAVWSVARAYGTTTSWTWNTAGLAVGNWVIEVWARNVGSTAAWEAFKTMSYTLRSPVSAVSLSANKTSPQARGTSIIFTAAATGTSGSYVYQYRLRTPSGVWSVARDYSSTPTWTWNTTVGQAAGSYQIEVWAKNTGSNASQEAYKKISFTLQ